MPNQTPPPPAAPRAIETDVVAIEAAMRRLTFLAVTEQQKLYDADGNPPILPDSEVGRIIFNPIGEGCHKAWQKLFGLLILLIGEKAATNMQNRINSEMPAPHPPSAKRAPFPSIARH